MNPISPSLRYLRPVMCTPILGAFTLLSTAGLCEERLPADADMMRRLMPSDAIIALGNAAPLIRYNRHLSGGAHTHGAWNGGWQITHALAAWAGNANADAKLREQISYNLRTANSISANGGYPSQHELHVTGMYAILRQSPRFWEGRLTAEQRGHIDLVMKAALVASAYTTADELYRGGNKVTALDGDTNLHRGWNPNYREGMFGGLLVSTVYFGGVEKTRHILETYDHAAFVAELERAGLGNTRDTFTWAASHPESSAPSGEQIQRIVRAYRFNDQPLMEPFELYRHLTLHTYGATVSAGLNNGKGILQDGVPTGVIAAGAENLPNPGAVGMLHEFDAMDANGRRSSITYAYDGFRPNLSSHVVLLVGGYWPRRNEASTELIRRLEIGITDLIYKLEHGYRNYAKGRGTTAPFDIHREHWDESFRCTLPLWTEILRPFHRE